MSSSALALITIPGVQKPHWTAPQSINACCMGCSCPFRLSPSMVSTRCPAASLIGTLQAFTAVPSSITRQAPQSPEEHPFFAPVRPSVSRSTRSSVHWGGTHTVRSTPFIYNEKFSMCRPPLLPPGVIRPCPNRLYLSAPAYCVPGRGRRSWYTAQTLFLRVFGLDTVYSILCVHILLAFHPAVNRSVAFLPLAQK